MNAEQLAEIKERAEKATLGPWEWGEGYEQKDPGYYVASKSNGHIVFADEDIAVRSEDVDFLLHAREDIPALVAEVERLNDEIADREQSHIKLYSDYRGEKASNKRLLDILTQISKMFSYNAGLRDARKLAREALNGD